MRTGVYLFFLVVIIMACVKRASDQRADSNDIKVLGDSFDTIVSANYPDSLKYAVIKANRLRSYFKMSTLDSTKRRMYEGLFFEEFPSDNMTFRIVYCNGMYEYGLQNLLIDESDEHVHFLLDGIRSIDSRKIFDKIVDVSKNAHWDPDDVLQEYLLELIEKDGSVLFSVLAARNDESVKGFFMYLFCGPHPPEELPIGISSLQGKHPRVVSLAMEALKESLVHD